MIYYIADMHFGHENAFIPILLASFKVVILQNIRDGSRMQDDNALCNSNVKLEGDEV